MQTSAGTVTRLTDIVCPPYVASTPPAGASILELAAYASDAANGYRAAVNTGADYDAVLRASGRLTRATDALTSAIADAVACGNGQLT